MSLFNFTLTLSGVTRSTPHLEDALYKAHCDDALICFYGTAVYLDFDRESDTLEHAILSAIKDIESAPTLNARVESVDAVLVGLSDIAELTGVSRQAISLLERGFPWCWSVSRPDTARKRQFTAMALANGG